MLTGKQSRDIHLAGQCAPQCLLGQVGRPDECHDGWLCSKLLCFTYLLATTSATCQFSQCQLQHRRRNKASPAAKVQPLRGARLKALLALDFCLCILGHSWNSSILMHISGPARVLHPGGNYSLVVRANLTVNMPLRIRVGAHRVFPPDPAKPPIFT